MVVSGQLELHGETLTCKSALSRHLAFADGCIPIRTTSADNGFGIVELVARHDDFTIPVIYRRRRVLRGAIIDAVNELAYKEMQRRSTYRACFSLASGSGE